MRKIALAMLMSALWLTTSAFRTDTIKVASAYLDTPDDVTVIIPDQKTPDERFPTVYLLHGYDGNHLQWTTTRPGLGELADRYGMVFVLPDARNGWYWDSPKQPGLQMESFITKTLVPYIDKHYPTIASADKRAVTGFSMGGHGAFWLGTRHPDLFRSIGSMSGGVDIVPFPKSWKMYEHLGPQQGNEEVWRTHSVMSLLPQMKANGSNIIFDCGVDDFFAKVNDKLHTDMIAAGIPHDYITRPGAHTHAYWANSLLYHLVFFNEVFKK